MARKAGVSIKTQIYQGFKGVDFSTDASMINDARSPWAVNIVSDNGGMPEKRAGYRSLRRFSPHDVPIKGIYKVEFGNIPGAFTNSYNGHGTVNVARLARKTGHTGTFFYMEGISVSTGNRSYHLETDGYSFDTEDAEEIKEMGIDWYAYDYEAISYADIRVPYYAGRPHFVVAFGDKIAVYDPVEDTSTEMATIHGTPKFVFISDKLYILTGEEMLVYDGASVRDVSEVAYIPRVVIASSPAGGGTTYESVNMMTGKRSVSYLADGTSTEYYLPETAYLTTGGPPIVSVEVNGSMTTAYSTIEDTYDIGAVKGIRFNTAPTAPSAGAADNVIITYDVGYSKIENIVKCTQGIAWGMGGTEDRLVCCGDPNKPNVDYISAYNDPTYFPDLNYAIIGTSDTAIMGYCRLGDALAIIKEDNGQGYTVYIRTGEMDANGNAIFPVKPAIAGVGAVSQRGFGNIGNEQLVLTGNGVYAITTNSLTAERIAQNRSMRIDTKLTKEDLSKAFVENFDNMMMIFVDSKVYILDGNQKSYATKDTTDFLYECYYWDNVPATCAFKSVENGKEHLYFGMADGRMCMFNTDMDGVDKYNDLGSAIHAVWATKADDDGDPMILKTMLKKGNAVTLKPYRRTSAKLCIRTDKDAVDWQANYGIADIFDWEDIDFSRFTFNANDSPQEIPFNRKVKNYKRLQFIIKNDGVNEGFGVFKITKHYVTGNFAKR